VLFSSSPLTALTSLKLSAVNADRTSVQPALYLAGVFNVLESFIPRLGRQLQVVSVAFGTAGEVRSEVRARELRRAKRGAFLMNQEQNERAKNS